MARSIKDETNDLLASGQVSKVEGNKFGARVRNVDQDPMDVNDTFVIPADYEVLERAITPGSDPVKFILVTLVNEVTGITRNIQFFPNMLAKVVFPLNDEGRRIGKVKTIGSAALEYQKYADQGADGMDLAVQALVGKKIKITAKTPYTVSEYGTGKPVPTNIYTYDFA